jgi:peptidoglycan-associated lipoprotein
MLKFFMRIGCGALLPALVALVGCSTTKENPPSPATGTNAAPISQPRTSGQKSGALSDNNLRGGQDQSSLDALRRGEAANTARDSAMKDVYFDFDQYNLDEDDRATLRINADWLKRNPATRVQIEGHCDERGTNEYNLALGAKRAQAAKDYLVSMGVVENRLSTISYGEEVPVCREATESCWKENRHDRFVRLGGVKGTF